MKFNRFELREALKLLSSLSSIEVIDEVTRNKLVSAIKKDKNEFISIVEKIKQMNPENSYISLILNNFYTEINKQKIKEESI